MIPGNAAGVAKQFLRCVFHQLAPNGIFPQLFQSIIKGNVQYLSAFLILSFLCMNSQCENVIQISDGSFLRTLATSLMDFSELSSIAALSQLLEVWLTIGCVSDANFIRISRVIYPHSSSNLLHQKHWIFVSSSLEVIRLSLPLVVHAIPSPSTAFCFQEHFYSYISVLPFHFIWWQFLLGIPKIYCQPFADCLLCSWLISTVPFFLLLEVVPCMCPVLPRTWRLPHTRCWHHFKTVHVFSGLTLGHKPQKHTWSMEH